MWSTVLDTLLTTLRFLAPATLLTIFWTHHAFFFNVLKYIDSAFRTVIFSNEDKKREVIQWLSEIGPIRIEELDTVWHHGWIVCGVLDAALPGACAGHPPTRLSLKHAQSIADHYLGVEPMFTRQELEANDSLSKHDEWKLVKFLDKVRLAIAKLSPQSATTKSRPENRISKSTQFTLDYIARGSGLTAAQVNNKMFFKIYPTAQQSLDPEEIKILIRGPNNIYGLSTLPPILGKAQMIRQTLLGTRAKSSNYTENVLPVTYGTAYLRNYGDNDIKKAYYIPKTKCDIDITIDTNQDYAKIGYTVPTEGQYEIAITSRDENIVGSPFIVTASKNIVDILEKDSFNLEDGEEIDIVDVKTDRKVVLRIVDFVTEKMLLKENGVLEKITDDEARDLMELNNTETSADDILKEKTEISDNEDGSLPTVISNKFYSVANKVLQMNRVCYALQDKDKHKHHQKCTISEIKSHGAVPDVVNSTFEKNIITNLYEKEKIIVPENISVSLLMDKPALTDLDKPILGSQSKNIENEPNKLYNENLESCKILQDLFEDDTQSIDTALSINNPFLSEMFNTTLTEKELGSFITTDYEANNSQNEESHTFSNPFINFEQSFNETGQNLGPFSSNYEEGSIQTDLISLSTDDILDRIEIIEHEVTNPFIEEDKSAATSENTLVTDFIIGAPVSLPSIVGNPIKETNENEIHFHETYNFRKDENVSCLSSRESLEQRDDPPAISPFHSLGSDTSNFLSQGNLQRSRNISPKDLWDSAYVSIDDSASSTDNNYNHSDRCISETFVKSIYPNNELIDSVSVKSGDTWSSSQQSEENSTHDDLRGLKWEFKRQVFTPIIEETEKSITCGTKENTFETDTVSRAFAELNEIYDDIFPMPNDSLSSVAEGSIVQKLEDEYIIEKNDIRVDSASENLLDVKRLAGKIEGLISEVQANDTESVSASRNLDVGGEDNFEKDNTKFGDTVYSNIVLEKKKYWDEKIRQIEAKNMEESKIQQKRKRLSAKHFRYNDSLSKRKGKQIVKNFLNSASSSSPQSKALEVDEKSSHLTTMSTNHSECRQNTVKLVNKWKSFWDEKLDEENNEKPQDVTRTSLQSANNSFEVNQTTDATIESNVKGVETKAENLTPTKHELPEEIFKAFETCPKRFFGTSRKHILNKIDSFLGKPPIEHMPKPESSNFNHETGLVSSRISLFHNISYTEEIPWKRKISTPKLCNIKSFKINDTTDGCLGINELDICKNAEYDTSTTLELPLTNEDNDIMTDVESSHKTQEELDITKTSTIGSEKSEIVKPITDDIYNKSIAEEYDVSRVKCRKLKTFSKSEMDLFSKTFSCDGSDDFDKHKSVENLPKINVKNFITLYEDVTKSTQSTLTRNDSKSFKSYKTLYNSSSSPGTPLKSYQNHSASKHFIKSHSQIESEFEDAETRCSSVLSEAQSSPETDKKYISLSDIELEIVEKNLDKEPDTDLKPDEISHVDYKSRFKMAKQYFQSLEELRDIKKDRKLSECKIVLNNHSIESLEDIDEKPKRKTRKTKSRSMPSSEIAKIWNEMQGNAVEKEDKKLVKISEKFNVEDLFEDVMEGRLSRQGSLRGIPHKKAVLEAFKSMENLSDNKLNSYDMAVSPCLSQQSQAKNAQTYLSEYPYLPTTDPSKFQPRFDAIASGLISYNELKSRPRRNSVPDIRLNPSFTEDL